jgi:hypothetical protein
MTGPFRLAGLSAVLVVSQVCMADTFSFTGTFTHDTDVQFFTFTLLNDTPGVALRTWSYAGGTNAAGQAILGGGFEPYLSFFQSDGTGMNPGFITNCTTLSLPQDPTTGGCDVSYPNPYSNPFPLGVWTAGTYTVALSLDANPGLGNLSDGFFATQVLGLAAPDNFTCGIYQGTPAAVPVTDPFCSSLGSGVPRTGFWALDILNVDSAVQEAVPEPGTLALGFLGVAAFAAKRRLCSARR